MRIYRIFCQRENNGKICWNSRQPGRTEVPYFVDGPDGSLETMADAENNVELKRKAEDNEDAGGDGEDDEWVGPMPSEAVTTKKRKGVYLSISPFPFNLWLKLSLATLAMLAEFPLTRLCFVFL